MAILERKSTVLILFIVVILSMTAVKLVDGAATPNNPCKTGFEPECLHNQLPRTPGEADKYSRGCSPIFRCRRGQTCSPRSKFKFLPNV